jgi:hypothetical protein
MLSRYPVHAQLVFVSSLSATKDQKNEKISFVVHRDMKLIWCKAKAVPLHATKALGGEEV